MSFVFSINRQKRSRSSTGESNSSFVKNVTSRVSGLLPAGITKWFSSPSSSSANGSAAVADGTDSSTEDETLDSSIAQPPTKRLRYSCVSPTGKYSQLTTSETTLTSNVTTETANGRYSIQSPPDRNTFRLETNFISTPIRAHIEDTNTDAIMENSERESVFKQHTVSAIGQSIALKRKSLFDSQKQKEQSLIACAKTAAQQVRDVKQPYFKPHLLGSPFYPGRTMYGGASASSTFINQPNIKRQKMTHVNESKVSDSVSMSSSSRMVMDLLENYSSPLIDAKRIPRYELSELRDINNTLQPSTSMRNSYKSQELYIPSTASIIRMKARSRLMDSTKAARQVIASHSSSLASYQPYAVDVTKRDLPNVTESGQTKTQSKLKSRLTRANRGDDLFGLPETVELPTAVLHIDRNNLPKFSFEGSTSKDTQTSILNTPSNEHFKFSSPIPITPDIKNTSSPVPAFGFDSPAKAAVNSSPPKFALGIQSNVETNQKLKQKKDETTLSSQDTATVIKIITTSNDWKCSDCWVSNKEEAQRCACCGANPPKQSAPINETMSKCAICKYASSKPNSDKCANCEKIRGSPITANSLAVHNTNVVSGKWKCADCWVDNEVSADKCCCCGSKNPKKGSTLSNEVPTKKLASEIDWRCEDCLITNKTNIEKCVACGGSKPGTKSAKVPLPSVASNKLVKDPELAEIVKFQQCFWECPVCLASNANDKSMCVCCSAEKESKDTAAPQFNNFKFKAEPNTGFKFGIDPKVQETNIAKKGEEFAKPKISEESETNNNIVPKISSFTFTLPTKKPGDKLYDAEKDALKPSFSFGIPKQNATPVGSGFVPINNILPETAVPDKDTEKPQEVPTISFSGPDATKPSTGLFSSPAPTLSPQNAMNAFVSNSVQKKKVAFPGNKLQNAATLETSNPQFSFGPVKSSTSSLFTTPASTAVNSSLSTQSPPATTLGQGMFPKTTITSAVSFFAKPESTQAPSSLFQNNISASTAAPAPAAATPMFSFGSTQSANTASVPSTEVKTFNFSFGSSNTAPAFGTAPQTNASTFSLPPGNPLANGISNPLCGNGIAANPLSQSIAGNPMGGSSGNGLAPNGNALLGSNSAPMFNAPATENTSMWPSTNDQTNQANPFMASNPTKPAFSFGATPAPSPFGAQATNVPHVFGGSPAPAQNMFGMNQNTASQSSMFPNPAASQPAPMFGSPQPANPAPAMGMFGATNATPFGASTPSMPSFEAPAPTFNFGGPQPSQGIFGFGQQPQQAAMQQMQPGMYNFPGAPSPGQVQFNMGSAPTSTAGRRVRKAVRRNPQR